MPVARWLHGRVPELEALAIRHGPDLQTVADALRVTRHALSAALREPSVRARWRAACRAHADGGPSMPASEPTPIFCPAGDTATLDAPPSARIRTLDELLDHAKVDRAQWGVTRCVVNSWEVGSAGPDGETVIAPLFQVKAWLERLRSAAAEQLRADLLADIARDMRYTRPVIVRSRAEPRDGYLLEISPFDLHVGKYAWAEEVGQDYDVNIASSRFLDALEDLLQRASGFPIARIALIIGNDLMQMDNAANTTTKGTRVDVDTRYAKVFRAARAVMARGLLRCAEIAPTEAVVVPGNHDELAAFHVGEVLAAQFAQHPLITVDNRPTPRKYLTHGTCLIGYTHGNNEKHADLPLIMATEQAREWATTEHHEWHIGHLHKSRETRYTAGDSFNGVRVRILPSLCGADYWHSKMGYVGERSACEAYLWHPTHGYAGHLSSNVPSAA